MMLRGVKVVLLVALIGLASACGSKSDGGGVSAVVPDGGVDGDSHADGRGAGADGAHADSLPGDVPMLPDVGEGAGDGGADVLPSFETLDDQDASGAQDALVGDSVDTQIPHDGSTEADTDVDAGPAGPPCVTDLECPEGEYCTATGCRRGGLPCSDTSDCENDPLGPQCNDGVCGGCVWYPPLWDWKYDASGPEIPDDGCPEGRHCPPGTSEACVADCIDDSQCAKPGSDFCGTEGICGCLDDPAFNTCEKFCMMASVGFVGQPLGKCVGCQQWLDPAGVSKQNPGVPIQPCKNDGACDMGKCLGGLCGFKGCADDAWCAGLKLPGYGVAQSTPHFRCSAANECVAVCETVDDCPAVLRLCIPGIACLPDPASGFSFCQVNGPP